MIVNSFGRTVQNTSSQTKRDFWDDFEAMIRRQFEHGGEKYGLEGEDEMEMTDLVCMLNPGKTGADWIMQTITKYCGRYCNFMRERDLLKIATYAYIAWLKGGFHLDVEHDEDVSKSGQGGHNCTQTDIQGDKKEAPHGG